MKHPPLQRLVHDQIEFHNVEELEPLGHGGGLSLQRFPSALRGGLGIRDHTRGRFYAHRAAGCELRFVTDGKFVRICLSVLEEDSVVTVYKGDHAHSQHRLPAGVVSALFLEDPVMFGNVSADALPRRRFQPDVWRITFHQDARAVYHGVESFGHALRPPLDHEVPALTWLAYGSSITFGASVFHAGNAYVTHAARLMGVDVLNKGLPGSCFCEESMIDYLSSRLRWDFATLEIGVNLTAWASSEEFAVMARRLLERVVAENPGRPVFVIDIYPNRADHWLDGAEISAMRTGRFREIVAELVDGMAAPCLRHIPADTVLSGLDGLGTDLLHPSDEGHIAMGGNLAGILNTHLPWNTMIPESRQP